MKNSEPITILFVDDNEELQTTISRTMIDEGYNIIS